MIWTISVSSSEKSHIKETIKIDYVKKFSEDTFEENYATYLKMPEFQAMWSIYNDNNQLKEEYKEFNKGVHFIMRLVAWYHINQAMKALKYDTTNDVNLASDGGSNIGSFWRVAKVWGWDKLDNSTFSEFGDGRFVPAPRLAVFPVESFKKKGHFSKDLKTFAVMKEEWFGYESVDEIYTVGYELKWVTKVLKFTDEDTAQVFFADLTNMNPDENIEIEMFPEQEIVKKEINQNGLGSTCSHHFLPYFINGQDSKIVIAYKPYKYLLGISKISRLVEFVLNRPSLQEGSTDMIFKEISRASGNQDVFVSMLNIVHSCEFTRWAKKETNTTTEKAGGCFRDETLRNHML